MHLPSKVVTLKDAGQNTAPRRHATVDRPKLELIIGGEPEDSDLEVEIGSLDRLIPDLSIAHLKRDRTTFLAERAYLRIDIGDMREQLGDLLPIVLGKLSGREPELDVSDAAVVLGFMCLAGEEPIVLATTFGADICSAAGIEQVHLAVATR